MILALILGCIGIGAAIGSAFVLALRAFDSYREDRRRFLEFWQANDRG